MAWGFLHGTGFAAISPPLMTLEPSLQTVLAGETCARPMLNHNPIIYNSILGFSNTSAVIACSVACMATRHSLTHAVRLLKQKFKAKPDTAPCRLHCCLQHL